MTKVLDSAAVPLKRRTLLSIAAASAAVATFALAGPVAFAQERPEIPMEELMQKTALPDVVHGNPDAKVTVIEYASMTCGHCANFHTNVYPQLKEKYIDTKKIRFILREFPLDNLAAAASMLARCTDSPARGEALTSALFKRRSEWVIRGNPVPPMFKIAKQVGFTEETFNKCINDRELLTKIAQVRDLASKKFGVSATPTFFINGKRLTGGSTLAEFEKVIEPLLKSDS